MIANRIGKFWLCAFLLVIWVNTGKVTAAKWTVGTAPQLLPAEILIGGQVPQGPGSTIVVVEGSSITLTATSVDMDQKNDGKVITNVPDDPYVNWSTTSGKLSAEHIASNNPVTFTAPKVPVGQATLTVTITATPDDFWTGVQTGVFPPDTGTINDNPGAGTVSLSVIVIKQADAPTKIAEVDSCTPTFPTLFEQWKTDGKPSLSAGLTYRKMQISGGNPPAARKNWNGFLVTESVVRDPNVPGTAQNNEFALLQPSTFGVQKNIATTVAFVVGYQPSAQFGCARPAADNCFWDTLAFQSSVQELLGAANAAAQTMNFVHTYAVIVAGGSTQLDNGAANKSWVDTWTFQNMDYTPIGKTTPIVVTTVAITRKTQ